MNIYLVTTSIIYIVMILTNNALVFSNYNIYILSILLFISIIALINTRAIKFRILLALIAFIIIKLLLQKLNHLFNQ